MVSAPRLLIRSHVGKRRGATAASVVAAAACFGLVVGAVLYVSSRTSPETAIDDSSVVGQPQPATADETPAADELSPSTAASTAPAAQASQPENSGPISAVQQVSHVVDAPSQLVAAEAREHKLTAQLEAGEFGPALATAQDASNARERSHLLKQVAAAQMDAGEFDGALAAIRRIPLPEQRRNARGERAEQQALAGGSTGADFTQLIELIKSNTSGLWEDEDGTGGSMTEFETGIRVDPNGMLYRLSKTEQNGRLAALGIQARKADLNEDMAKQSQLRLVSLTRLEKAVAQRIAEGKPVVESMKQLAGLSRIQYVFVFPENGEIIIGGPAEAWEYTASGQPVGVESGRPTLQLDDFVTVARTFAPGGSGMFNCLIVPRKEGLRDLKEYAEKSQARGSLSSTAVRSWVKQLQKRLGSQDVVINGVPTDSRVARVILEADYRMKLIGVGKLEGGKHIPSYFEILGQNPPKQLPALGALRWWLTMKYESVLHSPDHNVFEIRGSSVLCQSENEFITAQGDRVHTGQSEENNRLFASNFSEHYGKLAERDLVFADLQNIFDLALVTALIRHERLDQRTGWDLGQFASHGEYRPATFEPALTVDSVANHRVFRGGQIVVQVAGGVRADLMSVIKNSKVFKEAGRLKNLAGRGRAPQLPEGRWWWDAAE